jgi:hypothetical protein
MKSWNRYRSALPALLLIGCLGGDDGDGNNATLQFREHMVSIDRDARVLNTRYTSYSCSGDQTISSERTHMSRYAIAGGQLNMWGGQSCEGGVYQGTSSDVVGTWVGKGLAMSGPIPEAYRPDTCPAVLPPNPDSTALAMFKDMSLSIDISEAEILMTLSGRFCMGEFMSKAIMAQLKPPPGYPMPKVTAQGCDFVDITEPASGRTVHVQGGMTGNAMSLSLTMGSRTCSMSMPLPVDGVVPDCQAIRASALAYQQCLQGGNTAGFYEATLDVLAKATAR